MAMKALQQLGPFAPNLRDTRHYYTRPGAIAAIATSQPARVLNTITKPYLKQRIMQQHRLLKKHVITEWKPGDLPALFSLLLRYM